MTFDEHKQLWAAKFKEMGHTFIMDEDDEPPRIDWFVLSHGFHNGPGCSTCGYTCCQHCVAIDDIKACTGGDKP